MSESTDPNTTHSPSSPVQQEDILTDHEYDGIKEYDNPTPGWWNWLFIGTFVFSIFYFIFFHMGVGPSIESQYDAAQAAHIEVLFGDLGTLEPDQETILAYMNHADEKWLKRGASVFQQQCAKCHGSDGAGVAAPNMTDDKFIHVKKLEDIARVVAKGANKQLMPAWEKQLHPNDIVLVSAYVAKLRGDNLPTRGWAGAVGEPIDPWPTE